MAKKNKENSDILEITEPTQTENAPENENKVVISEEKPKGVVEVKTEVKIVPEPKKTISVVKSWKSSNKK